MDAAMTRRRLVGMGSLALTGGLLAPRSAVASTKLVSLRTTVKSWLYIAEDYALARGDFAVAGIEVSPVANGRGVLVDILLGGGCDLALVSPSQVLRARSLRRPVKIVGVLIDRYASHLIVRKELMDKARLTEASDPAEKIRLLKGMRIATPGPGSGADTLVRYLGEQAGLSAERDLTIVPVQGGSGAMLASFQQKVVDGFCFSSPASDLAVARFGGAYLFQMSRNPPPALATYPYMVIVAREASIARDRAALVAYLKGLNAAKVRMTADNAGYKTWAKGFLDGMDEAIFERAFDNDAAIAAAPMRMSPSQFEQCRQFAQRETERMDIPADFSALGFTDCVDASLLDEAGA